MKYYSEILKKNFDTEQECIDAETAFTEKQKELEAKKQEQINNQHKEKKLLSKAIEEADHELTIAINEYNEAKKQADKIVEEAKNKARIVMVKAGEDLNKAQDKKYKALMNFNKKFGAYTTTLTGDKALAECDRLNRLFSSMFNLFEF